MRDIEQIYWRLPAQVQEWMLTLYGLWHAASRYNATYRRIARAVEERKWLDADSLRQLQETRLKAIVREASLHVPYYRQLFAELGIGPEVIRRAEDLSLLPILDKQTVQERRQEFVSDRLSRLETRSVHTSGITGAGLVFPMKREAEREQWAVWWRYRARFGMDRSTWHANLFGKVIVPVTQTRPPYWRVDAVGHRLFLSAYHMSERNLPYYVEELNRRQFVWITGYPSLLALLAGHMLERGQGLSYRPEVVTAGAESLLPQQKLLIENGFKAPCRQHYGQAEAVSNISECPEGRLHVDEDFGLLEFVDRGDGALRIISTGFANEAFVLLRYDVGDTVTLPGDNTPCPCGRPERVVESIDGRVEDYVVTPSGARVGRLDQLFKDMVNVREAQIVQYARDQIEIRVVPGAQFGEPDRRRLLFEAHARLGSGARIEIVCTSALERSRTGKLRLVVSKLREGALVGGDAREGRPVLADSAEGTDGHSCCTP